MGRGGQMKTWCFQNGTIVKIQFGLPVVLILTLLVYA